MSGTPCRCRLGYLGLIPIGLLVGLGSDPAAAVQADAEPALRGSEASRAARLIGEALREHAVLPGLAIAVSTEDGIVFSAGFGLADLSSRAPASPLTRWRVGSISKSFTAAGAVLLAERGALDLDARVGELFPSWSGRPAGGVTPRQLAGHLGGIRHYREGEGIGRIHYEDVVDGLQLFADDSLVAPPGTAYRYSTYGYSLLSALMQRSAGQPFLEWMRHEVFEPLGMRHTGPDLATEVVPWRASFYEIRDGELVPASFTDNSYKWAGGGFLSTAEDMARFGRGLLGGRLLGPAGVATLFSSQRTSAGDETGYGMGFRPRQDRRGRRIAHHGGSSEGGRAFLLLYPDERLVVAMAANRSTAPLFEEEALGIAHFFLDHGPGAEAELDDELAGTWSLSGALGDTPVQGGLRLYGAGGVRGAMEWGEGRAPITVVLVDRHGQRLRIVGVGPRGLMEASLDPAPGGVWTGTWEYLGRSGVLELRAAPPHPA